MSDSEVGVVTVGTSGTRVAAVWVRRGSIDHALGPVNRKRGGWWA